MVLKTDLSQQKWDEETWKTIEAAMRFALQSENGSGRSQVAMLDELDRISGILYSRKNTSTQPKAHWSADRYARELPRGSSPYSFLTYAAGSGLVKYLEAKVGLRALNLTETAKRTLLYCATSHRVATSGETRDFHPPMVAFLLQSGIDLNKKYGITARRQDSMQTTIWCNYLQHLLRLADGLISAKKGPIEVPVTLLHIAKIMLMYGADPSARVGRFSSLQVIEKVFAEAPREALDEVRGMLPSEPQGSKRSVIEGPTVRSHPNKRLSRQYGREGHTPAHRRPSSIYQHKNAANPGDFQRFADREHHFRRRSSYNRSDWKQHPLKRQNQCDDHEYSRGYRRDF